MLDIRCGNLDVNVMSARHEKSTASATGGDDRGRGRCSRGVVPTFPILASSPPDSLLSPERLVRQPPKSFKRCSSSYYQSAGFPPGRFDSGPVGRLFAPTPLSWGFTFFPRWKTGVARRGPAAEPERSGRRNLTISTED